MRARLVLTLLLLNPPAVVSAEGPARRHVAGVVRDTQGRPIPDARIYAGAEAAGSSARNTDDQGRFELDLPNLAFPIAALADGHEPGGVLLPKDQVDCQITLRRAGEPPSAPLRTRAPQLPREEERALAKNLLNPVIERGLAAREKKTELIRPLEALAWVDPARLLELADQNLFNEPFYDNMFRQRVVEALLESSPDEAIAVIEAMAEPRFRALSYVYAAKHFLGRDNARVPPLLDQAQVEGRLADPPWLRVIATGQIGECWLDLGNREKGVALLNEAKSAAGSLTQAAHDGYARGALAEELAQIDLPAALDIMKDLTDPRELDRHHANVAQEIAASNPAEAIRVLGLIKERWQIERQTIPVLYRMVTVDPDRALALAQTMKGTTLRAYGLGLMASRLAPSNKPRALEIFAQAVAALDLPDGSDQKIFGMYPAECIAAILLPIAEELDPNLTPGLLWKSIALQTGQGFREFQLATLLARFDQPLAQALLDHEMATLDRHSVLGGSGKQPFAAFAVIDPKRLPAFLEKLPDESPMNPRGTKAAAVTVIANILGREGERRWKHLLQNEFFMWFPDIEDIDPTL
jgi:hypothetical protein